MKSKIHDSNASELAKQSFKKNNTNMTKKALLIIALSVSIVSCNKPAEVKEFKTAYIDTSVLMKEYTESVDIQAKYTAKAEEKGKQLEAEVNRFKQDANAFQTQAQQKGQAWAQQKGAELQKRQQDLEYAQQVLSQQLQQEGGKEMDSLVSKVKKFIKTYGKEKGYAYIYGTGDPATVLYAEDKYDITKEVIKLLNEKYKAPASTEATKKEEEK
jgi:outer membrane protein